MPADAHANEADGMVETVDRVAEVGRGDFYRRASAQSLAPLWRVLHGLVTEQPQSPCRPAVWHYDEVRPFLMEACDLISTHEAQRRVLVLENPGLPGQSRITRSLFAGLQVIKSGEIAPAHRHVATALRFIVEGQGAYTAVDGEKTYMSEGDFVITPSWTWHDHGNDSGKPMVWIDGLDMHIVNLFDASFREDYSGGTYPITRPEGFSTAELGSNLAPINHRSTSQTSPVFNYPYRITRDSLHATSRVREPDPCHGHMLQYINPLTGGPAIPTLTTAMQLLPKGFSTRSYRCTASTVFSVVEGTGVMKTAGFQCAWGPRDIFVVPSWAAFSLEAAADAVLFSYSDRAVQEKLDFFREQPGND